MLAVALVGCALFGVLAYAVLLKTGLIPGSSTPLRGRGPETLPPEIDGSPRPLRRYGVSDSSGAVATRIRAMPQGCLVAILVTAAIWFLLWGIVLVLALRILSSPY